MVEEKSIKLFGCGIFIVSLGIYSIFGTIMSAWAGYQSYLIYLDIFRRGLSPTAMRPETYLWVDVVSRLVVGLVVWSILISVGLYVAKSGIKSTKPYKETSET
jgi:hypothetical protein